VNEPRHPSGRTNLGWIVAAVLGLVVLIMTVGLLRGSKPSDMSATPPRATTATSTVTRDPASGLAWVDLGALPSQAQVTVRLIQRGGPYPYSKDGAVFANREGILPNHNHGYYHEFTVETPGASTRGARRIVTGDEDRQFFYTDDHYRTFRRVRI
jgi:ribonuclease T1